MGSKVSIIMYHYVRDLHNSRYPEIKGLDIAFFKEQLEYIKRHYNFITMDQLIDSVTNNISLPEKPILLTFDDGLIDHYLNVFPILYKNGIQGSFFIPVSAIIENKLLDVHKIQFILASCNDTRRLVIDIIALLDKYRDKYDLETNEYYQEKLGKPSKYDKAEVVFVKKLLQTELNKELRSIITTILFKKYLKIDECLFSRELYMSVDQIKIMNDFGMHIGSHGYCHNWLNSLSKEEQTSEIEQSLIFIDDVIGNLNSWTMCYPYGAYNRETIEILSEKKCKLALTTNTGIADFRKENRYELSRLDTNDIPKNKNSICNEWYNKY